MVREHGCASEGREAWKDEVDVYRRLGGWMGVGWADISRTLDLCVFVRVRVCARVRARMPNGLQIVCFLGCGWCRWWRVAGWLGAPEMYTPTHTCTPRTHAHTSTGGLNVVECEVPRVA